MTTYALTYIMSHRCGARDHHLPLANCTDAIWHLAEHKTAILYRERKCADTIGTVTVPLVGHF